MGGIENDDILVSHSNDSMVVLGDSAVHIGSHFISVTGIGNISEGQFISSTDSR